MGIRKLPIVQGSTIWERKSAMLIFTAVVVVLPKESKCAHRALNSYICSKEKAQDNLKTLTTHMQKFLGCMDGELLRPKHYYDGMEKGWGTEVSELYCAL